MPVMPQCELRVANGELGVMCDEQKCVYWRLVEQLDVPEEPKPQECAIQYFRLLEGGSQVAAWLLSVKERVEGDRSVKGAS
jgi:hypothetical protein